jgi:hypothetical protein
MSGQIAAVAAITSPPTGRSTSRALQAAVMTKPFTPNPKMSSSSVMSQPRRHHCQQATGDERHCEHANPTS